MADKNLVQNVITSFIEFTTDGLNIQKLYLKSCLIIFFAKLWKSKVISSQECQESLKKLCYSGFVIPRLLYMNLNCSTNTLPPYHSTHNLFTVAAMFLLAKITLSFNFKLQGVCLEALEDYVWV